MDILIFIFASFSLLGIVDCIIGNRLGIGKEFERGIFQNHPANVSAFHNAVVIFGKISLNLSNNFPYLNKR